MGEVGAIDVEVPGPSMPAHLPRPARKRTGRVKFFQQDKRMGFIHFEDGTPDAFFHSSSLEAVQGHDRVLPGTTVTALVSEDHLGRLRVQSILGIDGSTVTQACRNHSLRSKCNRRAPEAVDKHITASMKVKRFDPVRGFGFFEYALDQDVFVHSSVIKAAGLSVLEPGETMRVTFVQGDRGFQAIGVDTSVVRAPPAPAHRERRPLPAVRPPAQLVSA